jgi:hypothetical protein
MRQHPVSYTSGRGSASGPRHPCSSPALDNFLSSVHHSSTRRDATTTLCASNHHTMMPGELYRARTGRDLTKARGRQKRLLPRSLPSLKVGSAFGSAFSASFQTRSTPASMTKLGVSSRPHRPRFLKFLRWHLRQFRLQSPSPLPRCPHHWCGFVRAVRIGSSALFAVVTSALPTKAPRGVRLLAPSATPPAAEVRDVVTLSHILAQSVRLCLSLLPPSPPPSGVTRC